jgi:aminoglycoside phosphotransferase (APT) family kinase protein
MKVTTQTIEELIIHHVGKAPSHIEQIHGGSANFVFDVTVGKDHLIVRISENPAKLQLFVKEQWAVQKVREKKVPAPEILEVGNEAVPFPYMIVRRAEGLRAETHPKRARIVREMAEYTKIIHSIPTSGYGNVFDWSSNQLSRNETWEDFLIKEIKIARRLEILEKNEMMPLREFKKLKRVLKEMEKWDMKAVLNHGDMRLKNILVTKEGVISCILDWEMCSSHIPPFWDMSIALHDLGADEKQIFIEGYGMSMSEYLKIANYIRALNIINYAYFVEAAYIAKDQDKIEKFRARLHGALDIFSISDDFKTKPMSWLPFGLGDPD